jgi:hypothetical protein
MLLQTTLENEQVVVNYGRQAYHWLRREEVEALMQERTGGTALSGLVR